MSASPPAAPGQAAAQPAAGPPRYGAGGDGGAGGGRGARAPAALIAILGVALAVRLLHWAAVGGAPFVAQLVMDSDEYDRWARQIAAGDWLGHGVFFQAPLYPYLLAVLYKLVGPRLDAVYLAQILCGVAGCYALYRAGRATAGERVGLAAAALAAVYGPFVFYDVQLLKESLAATVVCFLLWTVAAAWSRPQPGAGPWFVVGTLLGILALLRENALLVVPFVLPLAFAARRGAPAGEEAAGYSAGADAAWRGGSRSGFFRAAVLRCIALVGGVVLILAPVALRNGLLGGDYLPTTFQGGVNFYIGNNPHADGTYRPIVPGKQVPELERREPARLAEQRLGRPLTPAQVSNYWLGRGLAWARADVPAFVGLQLRKLKLYWSWYEWPDAVDYYYVRGLSPVFRLPLLEFGGVTLLAALGLYLVVRRGLLRRFAPPLVWTFAWMLSTVAFFLFARYRLPGVPALMLLAAVPVAELVQAAAALRRQPAERLPGSRARRLVLAWGLALALAVALPRVVGFAPRADLVYFNLARLAEARGDADLARRNYEAVLAVAPGDFLSWLDLGNLSARRRDWARALDCYRRAAFLEPASDDAQTNLGGVYLALADPAAAAPHLAQALALNPQNVQALQNSALLNLQQGHLDQARQLNRRALQLDPQNPAVQRLRARLAAVPPP